MEDTKKHQDLDNTNVSPKTTPDNALSVSAGVVSQVPYDSNATPQLQTSETPLVSSSAYNNIMPQKNKVVKSDTQKSENRAEYLTDLLMRQRF